MGFTRFFENFIQIAVLLFAWAAGAARLLHPGDPALRHPDRVQADDARRLRAHSLRPLRQDRLPRRDACSATSSPPASRCWCSPSSSASARRSSRSSPQASAAASRRSTTRMAIVLAALAAARPRHLRTRHRQRPRLRRPAARRRRRRRHWPAPRAAMVARRRARPGRQRGRWPRRRHGRRRARWRGARRRRVLRLQPSSPAGPARRASRPARRCRRAALQAAAAPLRRAAAQPVDARSFAAGGRPASLHRRIVDRGRSAASRRRCGAVRPDRAIRPARLGAAHEAHPDDQPWRVRPPRTPSGPATAMAAAHSVDLSEGE